MELFDEVKNRYFHIVFKVLNECCYGMDKKDIIKILDEEEFQEKIIGKGQQTFAGLLLNEYEEEENYNMLKEKNGLNYPIIESSEKIKVPVRFTNIEKAWVKTLIEEPFIKTFLSENTINKLKEELAEIDVPISNNFIENTNTSKLAEIKKLDEYEINLKILLKAIIEEKSIRYCNTDKNGNLYCGKRSFPIRLEYSIKDERFRVSMYSLDDKRPIMANIWSMTDIVIDEDFKLDINRESVIEFLHKNKYSPEPIVFEVIDKKAAMERCFMSFSAMERTSRCIAENKYEISLFYYLFEEEDVIRKLLALGPYVKVISPNRIVNELISRIKFAIQNAGVK